MSQGLGLTVNDYLRQKEGYVLTQDLADWAGPQAGQVWLWQLQPSQVAYLLQTLWAKDGSDFSAAAPAAAAAAESEASSSSSSAAAVVEAFEEAADESSSSSAPSSSLSSSSLSSSSSHAAEGSESSAAAAEEPASSSSSSSMSSSSAAAAAVATTYPPRLLAFATRLVADARAYYASLSAADKEEADRVTDVKYTLEAAKEEWRRCAPLSSAVPPPEGLAALVAAGNGEALERQLATANTIGGKKKSGKK